MKTIQMRNPHLLRLFAAQVIPKQPNPSAQLRQESSMEPPAHDFLMINARPDLTQDVSFPLCAYKP
jgi:hypothetical protein